jgi:hypothetical protein
MPHGFTPTESSWATTSHDDLPMPGGAKLGQVAGLQFTLEEMGVPGVSAADARQQAAATYYNHLAKTFNEAGKAAIDAYLAQFPSVVPEPDPLELHALEPDSAEIGGADVVMNVTGAGFTDQSVIVFNGGDEPTTFYDDSHLSTVVKPSLAGAAVTVPVHVREGEQDSNDLQFEFAEAGQYTTKPNKLDKSDKPHKPKSKSKGKHGRK